MKHIQCAVNDVPFDIILYRTIVTTVKMEKRENIRSNYPFSIFYSYQGNQN